jgi:ppGpp synthetase/RelA/SpoT-type nucleotidyltranferase
MEKPLSNGEIRRLGRAMKLGPLVNSEQEALRELRKFWTYQIIELELSIRSYLSGIEHEFSFRTKNMNTILQKLDRTTIHLDDMRDVVGFRVIIDGDLNFQELIVNLLESHLAGNKPRRIDRLHKPMFGYRAIHLEVQFQGGPVEIQIRTSLQHQWAMLSERAVGILGPQIKYEESDEFSDIRSGLSELSALITDFENSIFSDTLAATTNYRLNIMKLVDEITHLINQREDQVP